MSFFFLGCAIVFTAAAQTLYKLFAENRKLPFLISTIALFVATPIMSYLALRELSLGVVYMSTGLTYILVLMSSRFVLRESVEKRQIFAVALIVAGVGVFNLQ